MTNRKSKTVRKISSPRIATPPARHAAAPCRPVRESQTCPTEPKSRNTQHATRLNPSSIHNPAVIIEPPTPFHAAGVRTRNGKVARLPYAVRDMINRMLRNNIPHSQIADALDELNFRVTERNISNWKTRGGYRDWCIAQDRALETRLLQDNLLEQLRKNDASQLAEVGLQLAATELSQFFLKPETRQQLNNEPEKLARTIGILCRLARQIHILQKYRDQSAKELGDDHNPERLKQETDETLESIRDTYSAEKIGESFKEPDVSHRNLLPKSGFPADPPRHEPVPDHTEFHHRSFQKLCDIIAEQNAERIAEAERAYRKSPEVSPSPEPEFSDDATPAADQPEPDAPGQSQSE